MEGGRSSGLWKSSLRAIGIKKVCKHDKHPIQLASSIMNSTADFKVGHHRFNIGG